MSERVYNLFLMWEDDVCRSVRYVVHKIDMDDVSALKFLQSRVPMDLNSSTQIQLTKPFTKKEYDARTRLRRGHFLYDEVFILLGAGQQPFHVVTPVVDNIPEVRFASEIGNPDIYLCEDVTKGYKMDDWISKYAEGNTFNIPALINDDYFSAIKITYNAKHYVSSMKLLVSAIDSLSYIEYGDWNGKQSVFETWLSTYADLSSLAITPQELWELRNSLLHMSNLHSRQVNKSAVRQISFHAGRKSHFESDGIHFFSFYGLIMTVAQAIKKWIETYNADPEKMVSFVSRYDKTISDSRLTVYTGTGNHSG